MNQNLQRDLQARIESFANDVAALLQAAVADAMKGALPTGGRRGAVAPGRKAGKKGRAAKKARGGRGPSEEAVLAEVKREGKRRITQIADALHTDSDAIRGTLKALVEAKKVRTTGQARGTKYSVA